MHRLGDGRPKKINLIEPNTWQNTPQTDGQWFEKHINSGKRVFLQLDVDAVDDVNREIEYDNISYAR